jgi:hypothetical protein
MSSTPPTTQQPPATPITLKSNVPIKPEDFEYLIMFLESKRQSGGGDISKSTQIDSRTLQVTYESCEVAERVVKKRFLKFKIYILVVSVASDRSSSSSSNNADESDDLMNKMFERDNKKLVIRNLNIVDASTGRKDTETAKLYAELLVTDDNNVAHIEFTHLTPDTFYVTYEKPIDRTFLKQRHEKKSVVGERRIELLDTFATNTYIIFSKQPKSYVKKVSYNTVKSKIKSLIRDSKKAGEEDICFFIESSTTYILLEFKDEVSSSLLQSFKSDLLKSGIVPVDAQLVIEYFPTFELLKNVIDNCADCFNVSIVGEPISQMGKKSGGVDAGKLKAGLAVASAQSVRYKLDLDPTSPLAICLVNCSQIHINLEQFLCRKSRNVQLIAFSENGTSHLFIESSQKLPVRNEEQWRGQVEDWLDEFVEDDLAFETVEVGLESSATAVNLHDLITIKIAEIRRSKYKASTFFELSRDKRYLHGYGMRTTLERNMNLLKEEISKRTGSSKRINSVSKKNTPCFQSAQPVPVGKVVKFVELELEMDSDTAASPKRKRKLSQNEHQHKSYNLRSKKK